MSNPTYYALQVIRVEGIRRKERDSTLYVEVKFDNAIRKTGTLSANAEPAWNGTVTFSCPHNDIGAFDVHLKKSRKRIGHVSINAAELLQESAESDVRRILLVPKERPWSRRKCSKLVGSIILRLKVVDAQTRAEIEVISAEGSVKQLNALMHRTDTASEVIGTAIEVTDVLIDVVDNVVQIHPVVKVSWQIATALYRAVSEQLRIDLQLVELVDKVRKTYEFYTNAESLDDRTEMLKPITKELLGEIIECSRFIQKYSEHNFLGRMARVIDHQEVQAHSDKLDSLRGDLNSAVGLHTAKTTDAIYERQQLVMKVGLETKAVATDIQLRQKVDELGKILEPSKLASDVSSRPRCLEGTREEYLTQIMDFLISESTPNILWLSGAAGSGKSTVAVTASDRCAKRGYQPVHLFFEREKSKSTSIIRTIAYMLADRYPPIAPYIIEAVNRNKNINDSEAGDQFKELLSEPIRAGGDAVKSSIVIILDALDECGNVNQRRDLLRLLQSDFSELPSNVRILVTSRPEYDIMKDLSARTGIHHVVLAHDSGSSKRDVAFYIRRKMEEKFQDRDGTWDKDVRVLCDAADGLFIWASTTIKMVCGGVRPRKKLHRFAANIQSVGESDIDSLYATVLRESGIWQDVDSRDDGMAVLGLVVVAKEAMSVPTMEAFLGFEQGSVDDILGRLRSVVRYEPGEPIRLYHASFADYLLSSERSGKDPWHIDAIQQKQAVTERCFDVMAERLQFNICNIESSFLRNSEIPRLKERIEENIPPHLSYACRFWSVHMCELVWPDDLIVVRDKLRCFAKAQLLYWLEVLSLTGYFSQIAGQALLNANIWTTSVDTELSSFLWTAYRLVVTFAYPISQSAPHIYLSVMSLWKGESPVADDYSKSHPFVKVDLLGVRTPARCIKVLRGHAKTINSVAISRDGRYIASASSDNTIRVWDADSGELISGPFEADSKVMSVAISPDSEHVVSGSSTGTICIWDVATGKHTSCPLRTGDYSYPSVAFAPDGRRVIAVVQAKVYIIDPENGELDSAQFEAGIYFVEVSSDGKYVYGYKNRKAGIWEAGTGKRVSAIMFDPGVIRTCAAISPDGKRAVTGKYRTTLIWNTDSGGRVITESYSSYVISVAFSPDGKRVVSGSMEGTIAMCDADSGQLIWGPFREHTSSVRSVIFTPDGKRVISGSDDGTIRIWDVGSTEITSGAFEAHTSSVRSVAFSHDGKRVVSGSWDTTIRIWDVDTSKHLSGPFEGHTDRVLSVAFSTDGKRVISGSGDKTIRIWDVDSGKLVMNPLEGHTNSVLSVAFSTNGNRIVSGSYDRTVRIWDANNGGLILGPLTSHTECVTSVAFAPDGKHIASGSDDNSVCIRDADNGELVLNPLEGHTGSVNSVVFSPDSKRVASGSADKTVRIWDVDRGELVSGPFEAHTESVMSVTFSPNGKCIASGSEDRTICVWDTDSGELVLGPLEGHTGGVRSVMFSPDGRHVVSGSEDETIRIWDVGCDGIGPGGVGKRATCVLPALSSQEDADADVGSSDQGPTTCRERSLSDWTLHDDGWVRSGRGELLTWIPEDMRGVLWRARNTAFFSSPFSMRLDLLNSRVGKRWSDGYHPK